MPGSLGNLLSAVHWSTALKTGLVTGVVALLLSFTPVARLYPNRYGNGSSSAPHRPRRGLRASEPLRLLPRRGAADGRGLGDACIAGVVPARGPRAARSRRMVGAAIADAPLARVRRSPHGAAAQRSRHRRHQRHRRRHRRAPSPPRATRRRHRRDRRRGRGGARRAPASTCAVLDVRDGDAVRALVDGLGELDVVVNCAGVIRRGAEHDPVVVRRDASTST